MGYEEDPMDFILAQVKDNVRFLQSRGRISENAAAEIDRLLAQPASMPSVAAATNQMRNLSFSAPPPPVQAPPPQAPRNEQAKALYDYSAPGDLNFREGDIIELTPGPDDNVDWWTGRVNGKTGLFPSNYVQKIAAPVSAPGPAAPGASHRLPPPPSMGQWNDKGPMQPYSSGPSAPAPSYYAPPGAPVPQPDPNDPAAQEQQKKKSKYGKLGSTMGNAAAGGVGFGAGAAIGSGIINAIF
ncbi:SH3-domain-containing protein [Clavulina sp. PMI_390]|nr:SH3-domain-containing protein [Clavulina sp. PMI_390]